MKQESSVQNIESISISYIKNLLSMNFSDNQKAYYQFLLDNGKVIKQDKSVLDKLPNKRIHLASTELKSCFNNSIKARFLNEDLKYYEGFYVTDLFQLPLEHGFNVMNNAVVDFTAIKFNIKVVEYFGVEIPDKVLIDFVTSKKYETPLQYFFRNSLLIVK